MTRFLSAVLFLCPSVTIAAPPAVSVVAYHPQGKVVAFGTHGEVRLFDPNTGNPAGASVAIPGRVTALAFDPTGKWLAAAGGEAGKGGEVRLFGVTPAGFVEPTAVSTITLHKDTVYTLAFSSDGKSLATAGYDRLIHVWDVPTNGKIAGNPRLTLKDHSDTIYAVAFNHDGTLLASGSADRSVKVWDAVSGKRLYTLSDPTEWVYCLAWSPDKRHLAAGGVDRSVRVWETSKDAVKLVAAAFAHERPVWRLTYSPDGNTLYSAGEDRVIKAWDAAKLNETKVFTVQPEAILDLALRPDGKQLAVARFDGVALLLDPATGKPTQQPLPTKPVPPKVAKLAPDSVVRGTSARVVVTGSNLDQVTAVTASSETVQVKILPDGRKPDRLELEVTTIAATPIGTVQLKLAAPDVAPATLALSVDRFPAVPEAGLTDSASIAQPVRLPVTLVGAIDRAGDADYFRFNATVGDQIGVQAITKELGSKLDAVLVITDEAGAVLAEGTTTLGYHVRKAGSYSLGIRDREYRGGADFTYRLHAGNVPVVTGVFPLAAQRGRSTDVHMEGVNLGSPGGIAARVTIPADAAVGSRFPLSVPAGPNRPLGAAEVLVSEFPSVVVDPAAGADLRVPGSADGILTKPGERQTARFDAKKGEPLVVEVLARRAGSPVDPIIEILDASGKVVQRSVLRCTAKTYTVFRDHDSGGPGIRIEAWNELAIDDYLFADGDLMRIVALPKNPDDDCQFYQVGGQRVGYLGTTPGHHAQSVTMYKVEFHPPGSTFPPNGLPVFSIDYRNDDGGPGYGKDSMLMFEAPAEGTYAVRVSDARGASGATHAYRVTVRPPKQDFSVSFNPNAPLVWKGGSIPVNVTVNRTDGFDGPVRVKLEGLPPGFTAPETFVEAGQTTTAFTLSASEEATVPSETKLRLVGRATIGGKEVVREAAAGLPKIVPLGEIVTRTSTQEVVLRPGQETKFIVDIERQGKFAGRVPVEVRGLPHGVRVLNIGLNGILITERESRREVVLYAEPWVKPMEHPIVVSARSEGKGTDHAAKSVLLKVQK